ncbi:MAG: hypothetical protein ACPGPE_04365 [Planctomycetota bacterium]
MNRNGAPPLRGLVASHLGGVHGQAGDVVVGVHERLTDEGDGPHL